MTNRASHVTLPYRRVSATGEAGCVGGEGGCGIRKEMADLSERSDPLGQGIRKEYLTGTAITTIVALLVLLVCRRGEAGKWLRRCPVCDHRILGSARYCGDCGSKLWVCA